MKDVEGNALPEWTSEELALLRSADADAPSARSLPAALAAVGVSGAIVAAAAGAQAASAVGASSAAGASGAAAASSAAAAKWGGAVALSKWIAVVALSGAAVAGGVVLSRHSHAIEQPVSRAIRGRTHAPQHSAKPPTAVPAAATPSTPEPPSALPPAPASKPDAARSMPLAKPAATQPDIHLEIAALDAALTTLRAGHASETLTALDRYDATFGRHSALRVEATALRIEALAQSGDRNKAGVLARSFLERHPSSPYAARIRALLATDSQPQR